MKLTRKEIIDGKYLIYIANEDEFYRIRINGFNLTIEYNGADLYSEKDNECIKNSTKEFERTYKRENYNDKTLTIDDIELLPRFPSRLSQGNFAKLVKDAPNDWRDNLCERYTPKIFIETFVMIEENYYKEMRKEFGKEGQKVLDEIFGADVTEKDIVTEKPFPKFMKGKHDGTIVLFSMPKNGMVIKIGNSIPLASQASNWIMDFFEDVEIEIIYK